MKPDTKVRWGILGAAQIARKNWVAIRNTGNAELVAVASRDLERCRAFVRECQAEAPFVVAPEAMGSYEALLGRPDIDAVYVPLPTISRKEWVIRAAEAGKHVLCEKPCAASAPELEVMIDACRRNRVQFMDGVMFMHSRRLAPMKAAIGAGTAIGVPQRISSAFSFPGSPEFFTDNIRLNSALEPLGCLGDLGWYCIRFALWAQGWSEPHSVAGRMLREQAGPGSPGPVPVEFSGELFFENGVSSDFYCSFVTGLQQRGCIVGPGGYLELSDFVLPFVGDELRARVRCAFFRVEGCDFNMEPHASDIRVAEYSHGHPTSQETNLFRVFSQGAQETEPDPFWPEVALKTQRITDACLASARAGGAVVRLR